MLREELASSTWDVCAKRVGEPSTIGTSPLPLNIDPVPTTKVDASLAF